MLRDYFSYYFVTYVGPKYRYPGGSAAQTIFHTTLVTKRNLNDQRNLTYILAPGKRAVRPRHGPRARPPSASAFSSPGSSVVASMSTHRSTVAIPTGYCRRAQPPGPALCARIQPTTSCPEAGRGSHPLLALGTPIERTTTRVTRCCRLVHARSIGARCKRLVGSMPSSSPPHRVHADVHTPSSLQPCGSACTAHAHHPAGHGKAPRSVVGRRVATTLLLLLLFLLLLLPPLLLLLLLLLRALRLLA